MVRIGHLLFIGLFFLLICSGIVLAQENQLWDEYGNWLTSEENVLKHEIRLNPAFNRITQKFDGTDTSGREIEYKYTYDYYSIEMAYRYYLNRRYYNKDVPFTYIPYNYRSSYIEVSGSYNAESDEYDYFGTHKYHGGYTSVDFLNHAENLFYGASFEYLERSEKNAFNRTETIDIEGSIGYYNNNGKYGLGVGYENIWSGRQYRISRDNRMLVRFFGEEMINPSLVVSASVNYLFDTDGGDEYWFEIPISGAYLIPYAWWEFETGFCYTKSKLISILDDKTYDWFMTARKYLNTMAFSAGLGYSVKTYEYADNSWGLTLNGECDYNIDTDFIFILNLFYGFGRGGLFDDKNSNIGGSVDIVAYL